MRHEIRLSGTGGQGIVTAGIILSEAALRAGCEVTMTQAYGPESRGGASKAEVIVDDEPIDYPKVVVPDILLVMSQAAFEKYGRVVKPGGTVIVDSSEVHDYSADSARLVAVPITHLARERLKGVVANIIALGVVVSATGIVPESELERAVLARVPKGTEDLNLEALRIGFGAGRESQVLQRSTPDSE